MEPDIIAINVARAEAVLDDGSIVPITKWLDDDNEECDPEFATEFVAGSDDLWFRASLGSYDLTGGGRQ